MTNNNGWSGKPGVPLNPAEPGFHWVESCDGTATVVFWRGHGGDTHYENGDLKELNHWSVHPMWQAKEWTYIGPCLTPAEVDAQANDALKWRDAINDALTEWHDPPRDGETPKAALRRLVHTEILAALDPAVSRPAADLVANARRDALEEAARWHDQQASEAQRLSDMKVSALDSKVWGDYAQNHREYATAIRALAKEEGDERMATD